MGSLNPLKQPSSPKLETPPPVPTAGNSAEDIAKAEAEALERLKKQRGRAATILSGASGDDSSGVATKALLGG